MSQKTPLCQINFESGAMKVLVLNRLDYIYFFKCFYEHFFINFYFFFLLYFICSLLCIILYYSIYDLLYFIVPHYYKEINNL